MKLYEKIALAAGALFTIVGTTLFWLMDPFLGAIFTVFVGGVVIWYLKLKSKGNVYLKQVAKLMGCRFRSGGPAYGRVEGRFLDHEVDIRIRRGQDSGRTLGGFILSQALLDSTMGVLAGIRNYTRVTIKHQLDVEGVYELDRQTFYDENLLVYLPPCNEFTGLPLLDEVGLVNHLIAAIQMLHKSHMS